MESDRIVLVTGMLDKLSRPLFELTVTADLVRSTVFFDYGESSCVLVCCHGEPYCLSVARWAEIFQSLSFLSGSRGTPAETFPGTCPVGRPGPDRGSEIWATANGNRRRLESPTGFYLRRLRAYQGPCSLVRSKNPELRPGDLALKQIDSLLEKKHKAKLDD